MKAMITLIVIAVILSFVAGCGPGEPFEIEGSNTPQSGTTLVAGAR
jgi:predicted small lipoprotein YifL